MGSFDLERQLQDLMRRVHLLEVGNPLGYSSVSEGSLRILSNEGLTVEGSAKVAGWLVVTGTQRLTGLLEGSGTLDWTGPWYMKGAGTVSGDTSWTGKVQIQGDCTVTGKMFVNGPWELNGTGKIAGNTTGTGKLTWTGAWDFQGNGTIKGNVDVTGALDVKSRLTLGPSGYIEAGTVRIDRLGSHGGRIASTGSVLALSAAGSVIVDAPYLTASAGSFTDLTAIGTISSKIKQFKIDHPLREGWVLCHGATESPVSGVEYWGDEILPESGTAVVTLPDYFEALTKLDGRSVLVTGRGFVADWGDIEDGKFTVTGTPGGRFSWLVKAEREGADFTVEEPAYGQEGR